MTADAWPWGTWVEWHDDEGVPRHGVVHGITELAGHIQVFYRRDDGQITRTNISVSAVDKSYAPEVTT